MGNYFFDTDADVEDLDRVDGKAKVTGQAKYAAEIELPNMAYGVLVGSNITRGSILSIDTSAAEKAAGVIAVITHLNVSKPPGYASSDPAKPPVAVRGLKIFDDATIHFNGQP